MPREIVITLPDFFTIDSARDAPEQYRCINTAKWTPEFIVDALHFGLSERSGNTWSVGKKSIEKMADGHKALEEGNWNAKRKTGTTTLKFNAAIAALNARQLFEKLSPEQLFELAKLAKADNAE